MPLTRKQRIEAYTYALLMTLKQGGVRYWSYIEEWEFYNDLICPSSAYPELPSICVPSESFDALCRAIEKAEKSKV